MSQPRRKKTGLKKLVRRKISRIGTGDGGAFSEKYLIIAGEQPTDTTFIVKDSVVVARPKEK